MNNTTFDPSTIIEAYRKTFAPAVKVQQEGVDVIDRVGRYQYAVAGDYLEWTLAQAKVALGAQTPTEFVSKQMELASALGEKLRARVQEFVTLATAAQTTFSQVVSEAAAKVAEVTKKAA
jgi:hypothetical protein